MKKVKETLKTGLNALVWKEEDLFVAQCLEVEVASQCGTKKSALANLEEALDLRTAIVPDHKEVAIGTFQSILRQAAMTREEFENYL
jgi:predicted RNase H-like HicB family nuclease